MTESLRAAVSVVGLFCLTVSVATVDAQSRHGDSVCELNGDSSGCALEDLKPSELDGSTLIYPGGETRCAFDDFSNASVSYATNATYFFQVFPNRKGDRNKLFLYFQGGGACIDDITCSFALQCIVPTFKANATAFSTGIANRTDPSNLFKDWNLVHIPYCTGDLHVGNRTEKITDDPLLSSFNSPDCMGHNMTLHQVGYTNTMAVLDWAYANFPDPSHIVLGGSSAGSLAAQLVSSLVAEKWQTETNDVAYSVLADSYVGVLPDSHPIGETLKYYGNCGVGMNRNVSSAVSNECDSGNLTTIDTMTSMIESIPRAKWLFVNSEDDYTQRYFYALVDEGIQGYPFGDLLTEAEFYSDMMAILDAYKAVSDKITTFYATGDQHVYLTANDFYHNATNDTTGEYLGSIIHRWLSSGNASIAGTPTTGCAQPSLWSVISLSLLVAAVALLVTIARRPRECGREDESETRRLLETQSS